MNQFLAAEISRICRDKPIVTIPPGIQPSSRAPKNGSEEKNGTIEVARIATIKGMRTKDLEGVVQSFSMTHGVNDENGSAIQIAGMRYKANGVNMQRRTGANVSVIFIHHNSGLGAASNPRVGKY